MDDFDAAMAEALASVEAVAEMRPAVRNDLTYVEAVALMFDRLAACKHTRYESAAMGIDTVARFCLDCGAEDPHSTGQWR